MNLRVINQNLLLDKHLNILTGVLKEAKSKDYKGWDKFDALNSPILNFLSFNNSYLHFFFQQAVKTLPINLRPLLFVPKEINPKGIALFIKTYSILYQITGNNEYLEEAKNLGDWLIENRNKKFENFCWGYNFIWSLLKNSLEKFDPNLIVTSFCGDALLDLYQLTNDKKYLEACISIANFILNDIALLHSSDTEMAFSYFRFKTNSITINVQTMAAMFFLRLWKLSGNEEYLNISKKLITFAVNCKTDYYAWYYTHPKGGSHLRHDNYHTGYVLDGIFAYSEETSDNQFDDVYWKGLDFYQKELFEENGAPKWMSDKAYPYDVHGASQGIITFSKAARHRPDLLAQAEKILNWTINNLYREKKHDFIYRKGQYFKWNFSFMRWGNAWMARAIAEYLNTKHYLENI